MSVITSKSNANSNTNTLEGDGEEHYVPIRDSASSSVRDASAVTGVDQNRHSDTASVGSAWARFDTSTQSHTEDLMSHYEENENEAITGQQGVSLQNRLVNAASGAGSSALFGSLELLKIAGGLTLSTTGTIMAPSLKVTQQVILPSLFAATMDYIKKLTPQRVKDWLRILSSSFFNFFSVLRETCRGKEFRSRVVTVGGDVVDCISSDASRQVITDGMATFVKLTEAMHTPEFKSFLEQTNVLGARFIDAASSGRNKQLVNDFKEMIWSGIELASDPATIVALAEVTATLCHTLEMEEVLHRRKMQNPKRRYERNAFTQKAYADAALAQDPNATVEQVIMSSLGGSSTCESTGPPMSVTVNPLESISIDKVAPPNQTDLSDEQGRLPGPNQHVDKRYLQQMINQRADAQAEQMDPARLLRPPTSTTKRKGTLKAQSTFDSRLDPEEVQNDIGDLIPETVLDEVEFDEGPPGFSFERQQTPKLRNCSTPSINPLIYERSSRPLGPHQEEDGESLNTTAPSTEQASETGVSRFYRTLDEIMERKRQEAANEMDEVDVLAAIRGVAIQPKANASAKKNFATLHRAAKKAALVQNLMKTVSKTRKKDSGLVIVVSLLFSCIVIVWFGCYGMYTFFRGTIGHRIGMGHTHHLTNGESTQEVVIRVIKEIVHVNPHCDPIDHHVSQASFDECQPFDSQQLAECILGIDEPINEEKIAECVTAIL